MPSKAGSSAEGPTLILPDLTFDDEGVYECEAYNSEGSDRYQGRIVVQGKEKKKAVSVSVSFCLVAIKDALIKSDQSYSAPVKCLHT